MSAEVFDVVVVGAGAAGLMTAIVCAQRGLKVLVVEKSPHVGGSAALSGGAIWAPGSGQMPLAERGEDVASARQYLRENIGRGMDEAMVDEFLKRAPEAIDFLARHTSVELQQRSYYPDYRTAVPGAALGGRVFEALPFDGRRLGKNLNLVRPPLAQFTLFGGMMINGKDINALLNAHRSLTNAAHAFRIVARYFFDRIFYGRATRLTIGNALAAGLMQTALAMKVEIRTSVVLDELLLVGGTVTGVACRSGAESLEFHARRAVVLASGGFSANPEMRKAHIPLHQSHVSVGASSNTGDGIRAALEVGAHLKGDYVGTAFLSPVSVMKSESGSTGEARIFPHLISDRQKPGLIAVNERGRRFVNEAASYHDFVLGMYEGKDGAASVPAYLICDSQFIRRYGLGLVKPRTLRLGSYLRSGYLHRGKTIRALGLAIGIDAGNFEETVRAFNENAASGEDPEFGRGSTAYQRLLGDPQSQPNPCIAPIVRAPFYAVRVWPGDLGTALGLETDVQTRVLDSNNAPIGGLFACGADMHSVMSGTYPAAGITLGPALTFGYLCGLAILEERPA